MESVGRCRTVVAAWLVASLLAAGCRAPGGVVRFVAPEGTAIRIGGEAPRRIPFETHLPLGAHPIAIAAAGAAESPPASPEEDTIRGWIVVLESWEGEPAEFSVSLDDLRDAAAGSFLRLSGSTPEGLEAFRVLASSFGVARDDPDVAQAETFAAMRLAAEPRSGFWDTMGAIGEGILTVLLFVLILAIEVSDDEEPEEDC